VRAAIGVRVAGEAAVNNLAFTHDLFTRSLFLAFTDCYYLGHIIETSG
jgi:hypothetical protein